MPNVGSLSKISNEQEEQSGGEPSKQPSTESHSNSNQANTREIKHQSLPDSSFQSKVQINYDHISNLPPNYSCQSKQFTCTKMFSTEESVSEINSSLLGNTDCQSKEQCTICLKDPPEWKGSLKPLDVAVLTFDKCSSKSTFLNLPSIHFGCKSIDAENGKFYMCRYCGVVRDRERGSFTMKKWNVHRQNCNAPKQEINLDRVELQY